MAFAPDINSVGSFLPNVVYKRSEKVFTNKFG